MLAVYAAPPAGGPPLCCPQQVHAHAGPPCLGGLVAPSGLLPGQGHSKKPRTPALIATPGTVRARVRWGPCSMPCPKILPLFRESTVRRWMPGPAEWLGLGEIPASSGALGCSSATAHSVSRLQLQLRRCCGPAPPWRSGNSPGLEARMSLSEHV